MSELILASPEERVKLLRAGLTGTQIESLYIRHNGFKIVTGPVLFNQGASGHGN